MEKLMQIEAAVYRQSGGMKLETLQLAAPGPDEVLVRIVSAGICHTDMSVMAGHFPPSSPAVLGHEGAGVVVAAGSRITHVAPDDHVVLTFNSCGQCYNCKDGHPAYCEDFFRFNMSGTRPDGTCTLHASDVAVGGYFFGQSSFATYALSTARNTVKVRSDAPLEFLGPLGCGFQTGAGAVLNVLKPRSDSTFVVFGCGGVGLSAVMAAKLVQCRRIIAVDRIESRLNLALALGATHAIDTTTQDPVPAIAALGGAHNVVEATGVPAVLEQAIRVLRPRGTCGVLGGPDPMATITLNIVSAFLGGHGVVGILEGDAEPHSFIPALIDHFMAGRFPIDRLIKHYALDNINQAIEDSRLGITIKPVIRFPHTVRS
jgi:aryl-alcohol dehydrogenase